MAAKPSVAIRIGIDGKTEVKQGFAEVASAAEAEARRLGRAFDQAGDMLVAAQRKQADLAAKMAAVLPATPTQARIAAVTGVSAEVKPARDSADAFRALVREQERMERQAVALRAQIDPLGTATARLDAELAQAERLQRAGVISAGELASAQALLRKRFEETTKALGGQAGALTAGEKAGRLNLARQGADVFTTAAMGMSPSMIAIQQGPQILDALSQSGLKLTPVMIAVGGAVAASAAAVLIAGKAALDYEAAQAKAAVAAGYMGRAAGLSVEDVNRLAEAAAAQSGASVAASRETEIALLNTGRIGREVPPALIALARDYAAATGQDAAQANAALAKTFADPAKGAEELTAQLHFLTAADLQRIEAMTASGQVSEAQALLTARLAEVTRGAADVSAGWTRVLHELKTGLDDAWEAAGRFFDRLAHGPSKRELASNARATYDAFGGGPEVLARVERLEREAVDDMFASAERQLREQTTARRADSSRDLRGAADRLDPKDAQRRRLQGDIGRLRASWAIHRPLRMPASTKAPPAPASPQARSRSPRSTRCGRT